MLVPESILTVTPWRNPITQVLRISQTLPTFMENQTILVLRTQRMLQTFGENLIIQALRKIMVMALPNWESSGGGMAPWAC